MSDHQAAQTQPSKAGARLVLLGASNLTRTFATAVETARHLLPGAPLDIIAAMGHGRSYGARSRVLLRELPGILDSGLWPALHPSASAPPTKGAPDAALRTIAVITDVGNDVMYGQSADVIANWLQQCVDRLLAQRARIVMTAMPIARIHRVRRWEFAALRSVMYPTRALRFGDAMATIDRLHGHMTDLCRRHGIPLIEMPESWYGIDPIHIRPRHKAAAWSRMLAFAAEGPQAVQAGDVRVSFGTRLRFRTLTPLDWQLLGVQRGRAQPCHRLADGTTISLF